MSKGKLYFILLQFIFIQNLFAYLDPGTGSYILQLLMMVLVGGVVAIKTFWQSIKNFISSIFNKNHSN